MVALPTSVNLFCAKRWLLANPKKQPFYINGQPRKGKLDSPEDVNNFAFYEDACDALKERGEGWHLGFALGPDEFGGYWQGIDFDKISENRLSDLANTAPSYVEKSPSGLGAHVIGYGRAFSALGSNGSGIEAYSSGRYFTFTENAIRMSELICLADYVERELAPRHSVKHKAATSNGVEETVVDAKTITELRSALLHMSADDYNIWVKMGLALRELGQTGKGLWLSWSAVSEKFDPSKAARKWETFNPTGTGYQSVFAEAQRQGWVNPNSNAAQISTQQAQQQINLDAIRKSAETVQQIQHEVLNHKCDEELAWPPGVAGEIAKFVYNFAPYPVKEIAISASLGLLAGICGKAWNISGTGLNLYIVLIARSGVGKEAIPEGIGAIINACKGSPTFANFVTFDEHASGPALIKACAANPSFVNIPGEWGRRMKGIAASENASESPSQTLQTMLTKLYSKSGRSSRAGGLCYSDKDKNVDIKGSIAYSMIGETTPEAFNESLTNSMMANGFISRFVIIEYNGDRGPKNNCRIDVLNPQLAKWLGDIAEQASQQNRHGNVTDLDDKMSNDARSLLDLFETECHQNLLEAGEDESKRHPWTRAALKAMRIAGLLAVADNCFNPVVNKEHAEWALSLVRHNLSVMKRRDDNGDIGENDSTRRKMLIEIMKDYVVKKPAKSYKIPEQLRTDGIVTNRYLQQRVDNKGAFYNHRLGADTALVNSLKAMTVSGMIAEVSATELSTKYNYGGKAYRIINLN